MTETIARKRAEALDAVDPLAHFRDEFVIDDPDLIYLDGNSLGRQPKRTAERVKRLLSEEWGKRLIRAWPESWIDLPRRLAGKIAQLIGAQPDEVMVCDSTSINLYKLTQAALLFQKGRRDIVTDSSNFPSDLYLLQGCAKESARRLKMAKPSRISEEISAQTALLALTHTAFKSGLIHPMESLTKIAHEHGAMVLWDLSHSVGAMPIHLNECGVDLAVGCTYKYVNGGPGAPAFLYVRKDLQEQLMSPIWGWFGHEHPFDFSLEYQPAPGIQRFQAGTPSIIAMASMEPGIDLLLEAGMEAIRAKSTAQTDFLVDLWEGLLSRHGVTLQSPRNGALRGSHVSLGHPSAYAIDQALIKEFNVIPDFRTPDNLRFGVAPLYTRFHDIAEGMIRLKEVLISGSYEKYPNQPSGVT